MQRIYLPWVDSGALQYLMWCSFVPNRPWSTETLPVFSAADFLINSGQYSLNAPVIEPTPAREPNISSVRLTSGLTTFFGWLRLSTTCGCTCKADTVINSLIPVTWAFVTRLPSGERGRMIHAKHGSEFFWPNGHSCDNLNQPTPICYAWLKGSRAGSMRWTGTHRPIDILSQTRMTTSLLSYDASSAYGPMIHLRVTRKLDPISSSQPVGI